MQYIYTMIGVSKVVPPKREIIKDISLSFFPGAKIGLLGLNGAGKSTVLRIMAGVVHSFPTRRSSGSEERRKGKECIWYKHRCHPRVKRRSAQRHCPSHR